MAFVKYSTVPLEVIADDQRSPEWVKKASDEDEERRKHLRGQMEGTLFDDRDLKNGN
jgi:hypothetical protein